MSCIPINALSAAQREQIEPSSIQLVAYGDQKVTNLGQIRGLEAEFDENAVFSNLDFMVTAENTLPIIGLNILFGSGPDFGDFGVDLNRMVATINGKAVRVFRQPELNDTAVVLSAVNVVKSSSSQKIKTGANTIIPARSEAVVWAKIDLPPDAENFMVNTTKITRFISGSRFTLPVANAVYNANQFDGFPMRIMNPFDADIELTAGTNLGKALPCDVGVQNAAVHTLSSVSDSNRLDSIWQQIHKGDMDQKSTERLRGILGKYLNTILLEDESPKVADVEEFKIYPKSTNPVATNNYRTPYALRNTMKRILKKNVENGLMEKTHSAWNSPTLLVAKPDGSKRLVCDFRALNQQIESDSYPLPQIKDLLVNLKKSRVFSCFDLLAGFHQVPCSAESREYLTVGTESGQHRWLVMPMGIKTAPTHFQRVMDILFQSLPLETALVYIDDVLVHSEDENSNLDRLDQVLALLASKGLQVKASKCKFLVKSIEFCGHEISEGEIRIPKKRIEALDKLQTPKSISEGQKLFGVLNYLRNMVKDFAVRSAPITAAYSKNRFAWTDEAEKAFRSIKSELLQSGLKLAIPDVQRDLFVLETDASNAGMAAVLYICSKRPDGETRCDFHQHDSSCLRPVEFWSEKFSPSQREKMFIREKELTCGRNAMLKWRIYLTGRQFVWWSDNSCLKYANQVRANRPIVARKFCEISEFDFVVQQRTSSQMVVSDYLSRAATLNSVRLSVPEWAKLQKEDTLLGKICSFVSQDRWPIEVHDSELDFWRRKRQHLLFGSKGELNYHPPIRAAEENIKKTTQPLLLVPSAMKKELLERYHDLNHHPGADNTLATLNRYFIWYHMREDVVEHVRTCRECQTDKPNLNPRKPPMKVTDTPNGPFVKMSCDLIGPLPITDNNNKYVFTLMDHFSKRLHARSIANKTANSTLAALKNIICNLPRRPNQLVTDNGLEFCGSFQLWLAANNIKQKRSSPYYPQANGLCERANGTLKGRLKCWRTPDWDEQLLDIVHEINLCPHEHTRFSPYEVEFGLRGTSSKSPVDLNDTARLVITEIRDLCLDRIKKEKESRSSRFSRDFIPYQVGDKVLIKSREKGSRFMGPYSIVESYSEGRTYMVESEDGAQRLRRRIEEMKPFYERLNVEEKIEEPPVLPVKQCQFIHDSNDSDFIWFYPNQGRGRSLLPPVSSPETIESDSRTSNHESLDNSYTSSAVPPLESGDEEMNAPLPELLLESEEEEMNVNQPAPNEELDQSQSDMSSSYETVDMPLNDLDDNSSESEKSVEIVAVEETNQRFMEREGRLVPKDEPMDLEITKQVAAPEENSNRKRTRSVDVGESSKAARVTRSRRMTVVQDLTNCGDSFLETFVAAPNFSQSPLSKDELKSHLRAAIENRWIGLNKADEYELNIIRNTFMVPNHIHENKKFSNYLLEVCSQHTNVRKVKVDGVDWACVLIQESYDAARCVPVIGLDYGGSYLLNKMRYHQLLKLALDLEIQISHAEFMTSRCLVERISQFAINSNDNMQVVVENGSTYLVMVNDSQL